ncbi:Holliday junction resolvase RecU [Paenibacillus sp. 11B]|nr:Holliday junction resolvase RecU [Paenibacillus sp. 11B]MDN8590963.1 Holliday junction resolvase RecU [Paenibacillus sp. 11B]
MTLQGNRGMGFEAIITFSNERYDKLGLAVVNKRPTPVKVVKVAGSTVIEGYYEEPSTVDYDGIIKTGRGIAFEAKSIASLDRFQLKNLKDHQVEYLLKAHKMNGISFLLVEFRKQHKTYLLPYTVLRFFWDAYKRKQGSSIHISDFDIHAYEVPDKRVPVDYLWAVERHWQASGS